MFLFVAHIALTIQDGCLSVVNPQNNGSSIASARSSSASNCDKIVTSASKTSDGGKRKRDIPGAPLALYHASMHQSPVMSARGSAYFDALTRPSVRVIVCFRLAFAVAAPRAAIDR